MDFRRKIFQRYVEEDEKIIEIINKHWFIEFKNFVKGIIIGFLLPFFVWTLFPVFKYICILWSIIWIVRMIYDLCDWFLDAWLLTDQSVVGVEWNGFFSQSSNRIDYSTIESVGYEVKGFFKTLFKFGNVSIQQPGGNVVFTDINNPKFVAKRIGEVQEEILHSKGLTDEANLRDILARIVKGHIESHGIDLTNQF